MSHINIVQISDTHLGEAPADETRTRELVEHIRETYSPTDTVVVHTGDVTQDGAAAQFEIATRVFRPLVESGFQFLPCPGNHDYRFSGIIPDDDAAARFHEWRFDLAGAPKHWPYVAVRGPARIICLDSCAHATWHALARGEVGYGQRMKLAEYMEMDQGLKNLVFLHHHPIDQELGCEMLDAGLFLAELSARCELVGFGHNHAWGLWREVYGIDWVVASGKSTNLVDGRLNYWLIRIDSAGPTKVKRIAVT